MPQPPPKVAKACILAACHAHNRLQSACSVIYHAFGSRGGLVGRAWVRAARRFLALQKQVVDAEDEPVRAVIAAADAPPVFSE